MFIVDDEKKPHWVYIGYTPSLGFDLDDITTVITIDPMTGEVVRYAPDKVPAWIDIVYKSKLIKERLNDHGKYAGGWWNAFWAQANVESVDSIELVAGNDGRLVWVSGISQPHRNNDALVAMVYTDVVTGKNTATRLPAARPTRASSRR